MGIDLSFRAVRRSRWSVAAMAVVALSAAFLTVDGLLNGRWLQILWIALCAASAIGWWRETAHDVKAPARTPGLSTALWSAALAVAGIAALAMQHSVLALAAGALLIVSAACGAAAVYWGVRARRST